MNPQIRDLYERARTLATQANALLAGDNPTPEAVTQARALIDQSTSLEERAGTLRNAERLMRSGDDLEAQEREDFRRRAEQDAQSRIRGTQLPPDSGGSRATPRNSDGEAEITEPPDEHEVNDEDVADYRQFMSVFGEFIQERRQKEGPDAKKRRIAFRAAISRGLGSVPPELRKHIATKEVDPQSEEFRAHGIASQESMGILIPPEIQREIAFAKKAVGGFRDLRTNFFSTGNGRQYPFPTIDDTANEGSYVGEHQKLPEAEDIKVQGHMANAYWLTSGSIKISLALANDLDFPLEGMISRLGGLRNERRFQRALTSGDGVSKPAGVVPLVPVGAIAQNPNSFVPEDIYALKHGPIGVNPAYHSDGQFMVSQDAIFRLKTMADSDFRGLWQRGIGNDQPPTIDESDYAVNHHMDTVAAGNDPILFGDWWWMMAREVVPDTVIVLREKYVDNLQIGFIVAARNDGRFINPGGSAVAPIKKLRMAE